MARPGDSIDRQNAVQSYILHLYSGRMTHRAVLAEADGGPAPALPATWTAAVQAASDPASAAVISVHGVISYGSLLRMSAAAVELLDSLGLPPGVAVPALLDAGPVAYALWIAGACSRRPIAPLAPRSTVPELLACVREDDAPVVLASPANQGVATGLATATGRRAVVVDGLPESARPLDLLGGDPDDVVGVLHTSGTTGLPKRVLLRQRPLAGRTVAYAAALGLTPGSVYASAASFHHAAGISLVAVALGTGVALTPMPSRFSVRGWRALEGLGVTHANVVPAMLDALLDAGALRQGGVLRTLLYGASRIEPELARRTLASLPDVELIQGYGQTEGGPHTLLTGADHRRAVADPTQAPLLLSCGRPAPGVRVRIVGAAEGAGDDGVGLVEVSSPYLFAAGPEGWLGSGDIGRLGEGGYLYLVGRSGDGIVRGGENVYPVEVERVLADHPAVRDAAVVGIPDDRLGHAVGALVVPADPGAPPDPDELRRHVRARLAGYKVPVVWQLVPELPRNPMGKLLRHRLPAMTT
jgi:acyl-CoA synthetase (AMP-forming)/AMP-acid ligase II